MRMRKSNTWVLLVGMYNGTVPLNDMVVTKSQKLLHKPAAPLLAIYPKEMTARHSHQSQRPQGVRNSRFTKRRADKQNIDK